MLSSNVSTWLNRNCSSCFVKCQHNQTIHYFCFVCGLICQIFLKVIVNCRGILLFMNAVSNLSLFANCNKLNLIHTLVAIVEVASSSFVWVVRGQLSWYVVVYEWRIILVPICNCITNNIVEMASSSFVRVVRGESATKRPMTKVEGRGEGGVMGGRCWGTKGSAKSDD
jgi:hypothetical protein